VAIVEPKVDPMNNINKIICNDNLKVMKDMSSSSIDLVYLDPPLSVDDDLNVIKFLRPRIKEIHRILKDDGSIFFHTDWRAENQIHVLLDGIFGEMNLIAKIIWQRNNRTIPSKFISHTYDAILFYGKTSNIKYFPQYIDYSDNEKESLYKYIENETGRRYMLVGLTRPNATDRPNLIYEFLGITRTWRFSKEKMENELKQGRIVQSKPEAVPMYKQYMGEGKPLGDIWTDLPLIRVSKEMTGYPTQKPLALLERMISMSTQKGDLVFDPFCGSGTSLVAAEKLGRKWLGVDISPSACQISSQRIQQIQKDSSDDPLQLQDNKTLKQMQNMPHYEFESWVITALANLFNNNPEFSESIGLAPSPTMKVYSIAKDIGFDAELDGRENSIPVMVKHKEKVGAKEIQNFAIQLKHHKRKKGLFIAFSFSKIALDEIGKRRLEGLEITPISARDILSERI
jgi:DNA modification methylase